MGAGDDDDDEMVGGLAASRGEVRELSLKRSPKKCAALIWSCFCFHGASRSLEAIN